MHGPPSWNVPISGESAATKLFESIAELTALSGTSSIRAGPSRSGGSTVQQQQREQVRGPM